MTSASFLDLRLAGGDALNGNDYYSFRRRRRRDIFSPCRLFAAETASMRAQDACCGRRAARFSMRGADDFWSFRRLFLMRGATTTYSLLRLAASS